MANKTRAQLIRDAKSGNMSLEMIEYYGNKNVPPRVQGIRKVIKINSVDMLLKQSDGEVSHLSIPKASLMDYIGNKLFIYAGGYREPNAKEQAILGKWEKHTQDPNFKQREQVDLMTDGSSTFYEKKRFFYDHKAEYLMGYEKQGGCKLDHNMRNRGEKDYIFDDSIKGEPMLAYRVYMKE